MKFAILSVAAAGALAFSVGTASAQPWHNHGGYTHGGYSYGHPVGPHLDYHRGHFHLHDGWYRSAPLVPVVPTYSYPNYGYGYSYNSGFGLTIQRPSVTLSFGSGNVTPLYVQPYYGGSYYGGRRW